jgi:hypothetical protein
MRGVPTLIRLARQEVDERRSDLVRIAAARASAAEALDTHDAEAAREAAVSMTSALELAAFSAWARQATRARARLQQRFAELGRSEATARESLRDAIAQMKRLDIVLESAEAARREIATQRAGMRADERETARHTAMAEAA